MRILVQKFGGTSVANAERLLQVKNKITDGFERGFDKIIVVLSAMSGETNRLIALAQERCSNPDPAEMDSLVSTGEQVSVALFAMLLKENGIRARSVLGFQIPIHTDTEFGSARILDIDSEKISQLLKSYDVLVVAGFQGYTVTGRISTLGRGGSDTSAVALAAAMQAELCEIYTDVEGVYTTDPNICSKAQKIDRISYEEMLEMASMGAKVLQIRSVAFAKRYNIPLLVRSTFCNNTGTLLTEEDKSMETAMISGIAYDKDQARITLADVEDNPGIAAQIFLPISNAGIIVDMIVQNPSHDGLTDMTFTVPRASLNKTLAILEKLKSELSYRELLFDNDVSKISVIGVGMRNHSGIAAITFSTLQKENINIMIISTSEIKISCLIEEKYTELAIRSLHEAFGLDKDE